MKTLRLTINSQALIVFLKKRENTVFSTRIIKSKFMIIYCFFKTMSRLYLLKKLSVFSLLGEYDGDK